MNQTCSTCLEWQPKKKRKRGDCVAARVLVTDVMSQRQRVAYPVTRRSEGCADWKPGTYVARRWQADRLAQQIEDAEEPCGPDGTDRIAREVEIVVDGHTITDDAAILNDDPSDVNLWPTDKPPP